MWRRYLALTKPKVVALITFTAIVGALLASPGLPPPGALLWGNSALRSPQPAPPPSTTYSTVVSMSR